MAPEFAYPFIITIGSTALGGLSLEALPIFTPLDFVTIFSTEVWLSAPSPIPSNSGGPMIFCRGCLP